MVIVILSISVGLLSLAQSFNRLINRLEAKTCLKRAKAFVFSSGSVSLTAVLTRLPVRNSYKPLCLLGGLKKSAPG